MNIQGLKEKAKDIKSNAGDVMDIALDKIDETLNEFNEAISTLLALGFTVKDLQVGMGKLTPEISSKLCASVDAINAEKIQVLIDKNQDKKFLVTILKAFQAVSKIKDQLGNLKFKGVEADIKLGMPPSVKVDFLKSMPNLHND